MTFIFPLEIYKEIANKCDNCMRAMLGMTSNKMMNICVDKKLKNVRLVNEASRLGYLKLTKWCVYHGYCVNTITCAYAAYSGNIGLVQWLREIGCNWDTSVLGMAAFGGKLEMLKYLKTKQIGKLETYHKSIIRFAKLKEYIFNTRWFTAPCLNAALGGHLKVLMWLLSNNCCKSKSICLNAVLSGNIEVVKWTKENGCMWRKKYICSYAENIETLTYLHNMGGEINAETMIKMGRHYKLRIMKWIHKMIELSYTHSGISLNREIKMYEWICKNMCKRSRSNDETEEIFIEEREREYLRRDAKIANRYDVIEWLNKYNY